MNKQQLTGRPFGMQRDNEGEPAETEIPVPPGEDVPAPIKEPFEEDKPNEPIIDEEKKAPKLIV